MFSKPAFLAILGIEYVDENSASQIYRVKSRNFIDD